MFVWVFICLWCELWVLDALFCLCNKCYIIIIIIIIIIIVIVIIIIIIKPCSIYVLELGQETFFVGLTLF